MPFTAAVLCQEQRDADEKECCQGTVELLFVSTVVCFPRSLDRDIFKHSIYSRL
jgi:hypothetical protein